MELRRLHQDESAVTLLEVSVATMIVTVAIFSALSAFSSLQVMEVMAREYALADSAARQQLEEARCRILTLLAADERERIFDAGSGCGSEAHPGTFAVPGLKPLAPAAAPGRMFAIAREDSAWLGDPVDLDMDGRITGEIGSVEQRVFPVRVDVTWLGPNGKRLFYSLSTIVAPDRF